MLTELDLPTTPLPDGPTASDPRRAALLGLLGLLEEVGYDFVTATPNTHARVIGRPGHEIGRSLRDLLGWSLPVAPDALQQPIVAALDEAGLLQRRADGLLAAAVRVSRVYGSLFLHSAYPTTAQDSVFLGPDSYRFADLIVRQKSELPPGAQVLDYAAGAGVGGITAARGQAGVRLTLADINPKALFLSSINAEHAGIAHRTVEAASPADLAGPFDLIVTHPPFMMDGGHRAYRDGGDLYGARLSFDWTLGFLPKLAPGGRFVMHTGVSIVNGRDVLLDALRQAMPATGFRWDYHLLDPDIFGDELDQPPYAEVERIAAIGLTVTRT